LVVESGLLTERGLGNVEDKTKDSLELAKIVLFLGIFLRVLGIEWRIDF
jgi:hypothetical protein